MKILVFEIFEKGQILRPFSGLATLKRKFFQKNLMVAYVHIEYSTYQFSEESKGEVEFTPPPRPLRYRKSEVLRGLSNHATNTNLANKSSVHLEGQATPLEEERIKFNDSFI